MKQLLASALALGLIAAPAAADEIEDVINGLLEIYQSGDKKLFAEETDYLNQLAQEQVGDDFQQYLPAALEPWTMEVLPPDAGLAMLGGGVSAKARYTNGGESFTITLSAKNQMVTAMSGMFGSSAVLASMGDVFRIGRDKFVMSDNEVQGLINKTVLIQAQGDNPEAMRAHIESMAMGDLRAY